VDLHQNNGTAHRSYVSYIISIKALCCQLCSIHCASSMNNCVKRTSAIKVDTIKLKLKMISMKGIENHLMPTTKLTHFAVSKDDTGRIQTFSATSLKPWRYTICSLCVCRISYSRIVEISFKFPAAVQGKISLSFFSGADLGGALGAEAPPFKIIL